MFVSVATAAERAHETKRENTRFLSVWGVQRRDEVCTIAVPFLHLVNVATGSPVGATAVSCLMNNACPSP